MAAGMICYVVAVLSAALWPQADSGSYVSSSESLSESSLGTMWTLPWK